MSKAAFEETIREISKSDFEAQLRELLTRKELYGRAYETCKDSSHLGSSLLGLARSHLMLEADILTFIETWGPR